MATASKATKPPAKLVKVVKAKSAAPPKAASGAKPKAPVKKNATPKPKAVVANIVAKPAAAPPKKPLKAATKPGAPKVSAEQRRHYVEVAAYFIAERNGFAADSVLDHWVQAEAEIDRLLKEGKLNT
jgi:hypothetical protein